MKNSKSWLAGFLVALVMMGGVGKAEAVQIINEDFTSGISSDWIVDSYVSAEGGNAVLAGQLYTQDVPLISLSRAVDLSMAGIYNLRFKVKFYNTDVESGFNGEPNYFQASYLDDIFYDPETGVSPFDNVFMAFDMNGIYGETIGTLSGEIVDGWYSYSQNISVLAGTGGTLYFDLYDRGYEFTSVALLDDIILDYQSSTAPVPEPSTLLLLAAGGGCLFFKLRRRKG
ncbi:MAG: PEP-CTERM sorting domain-containing protein [Desulfuromonadaceae bacterium]|nr:PEP-CTERM sorting domain-containing protein [Desulfuromonadaceae bacterium]MDD5106332.1 PEP-CTERM sorting domain-containing protein [Desulfuromonadaceae bacterium]